MLPFRQKAFSFVEIMVVIFIILLLTAISIPLWRRLAPRLQLNHETEKIVEELRLAQQKTVTEQIVYMLRFDKITESYEVIRFIPDPESPGDYIEEQVRTVTLDPEVEILEIYDLTDSEIEFTAAGGVVEAGRIELANQRGTTKLIDVRPSGFINY